MGNDALARLAPLVGQAGARIHETRQTMARVAGEHSAEPLHIAAQFYSVSSSEEH